MGIEGKEKVKTLETGAHALSGQLGKTIQRLRKAYNLSLSELAEQSGVAKSIISQIERNETNPTLATIWRLAQALEEIADVGVQRAGHLPQLRGADPVGGAFVFLDLLEGQADGFGQFFLADRQFLAAHADAQADVAVDGVRTPVQLGELIHSNPIAKLF